jgi:succinyl-CoA synthetase beta subunit
MLSVSAIVEKMVHLFLDKDLDLIEINPLGVRLPNEVMALDGKVTLNDAALARHPELSSLLTPSTLPESYALTTVGSGNIGIVCNGAGLALATLDLVKGAGGYPSRLLNIGSEAQYDWPPTDLTQQLEQGLIQLASDRTVSAILINLFCTVTDCSAIATLLINLLQRRATEPNLPPFPNLVIRLVGQGATSARAQLAAVGMPMWEHLDGAIAEVVALAQPSRPLSLIPH